MLDPISREQRSNSALLSVDQHSGHWAEYIDFHDFTTDDHCSSLASALVVPFQ
jgi:hypothetical protein